METNLQKQILVIPSYTEIKRKNKAGTKEMTIDIQEVKKRWAKI